MLSYPAYRDWKKGYEYAEKKHMYWAIPFYESALAQLPEYGELQFHLGSALAFSGSHSRALIYLERASETFNDRNFHLSRSYTCLKLGKLSDAEKSAKTALWMLADHLAPHLLLGEIYLEMGDTTRSKSSLRKCINKETRIRSDDMVQISSDARKLWHRLFRESI